MKKIAITLSTATLLMGALLGCGANQDNGVGGLGTADQRGFGYHATDGDNGYTGERAGEGPITDMFTRDDRRGARGLGREGRHPATGLAGPRNTPHQFGMTRGDLENRTGTGGITGLGNNLGMTEQGGPSYGTMDQNRGMRGANTRFGTGLNKNRAAGIVGNREGYVDDRGILRGEGTRDHNRIGGLGTRGRSEKGRFGGLTTGMTDQYDRTEDGNIQGRGMRNYSYPKGYDTNTVDRISTRLADVDNVSDSRVIIHGNSIIVAVETEGQNTQRIEQDVRRTVANMAGNREIIVVTDKEQYNQIRTADDRLRAGEPFESLGESMNEMFHDFKRATNRPAQSR